MHPVAPHSKRSTREHNKIPEFSIGGDLTVPPSGYSNRIYATTDTHQPTSPRSGPLQHQSCCCCLLRFLQYDMYMGGTVDCRHLVKMKLCVSHAGRLSDSTATLLNHARVCLSSDPFGSAVCTSNLQPNQIRPSRLKSALVMNNFICLIPVQQERVSNV